MAYQIFKDNKPYAYHPVESMEDAQSDLKREHEDCARSAGTEDISEIEENSFTVTTARGTHTYTIEQV